MLNKIGLSMRQGPGPELQAINAQRDTLLAKSPAELTAAEIDRLAALNDRALQILTEKIGTGGMLVDSV